MTRGEENNNPGNIEFAAHQFRHNPWIGETGIEARGRFTTFDSPVHGIRAIARVLLTYHRYRLAADGSRIDTVREIVERWSEDNHSNYAKRIRDAIGVKLGETINIGDPKILRGLVASIILFENGQQIYDMDTIAASVELALL